MDQIADIILVHGIAQEQYSADSLEQIWVPSLAGGIRTAGYPQLADRVWRAAHGDGAIEVRMAFYGDCFLRPGEMGADYSARSPQDVAISLLREWLLAASSRVQPDEAPYVIRGLQDLEGAEGEQQGTGAAARKALVAFSRLRWFAPLGMGVAERLVQRALRQVSSYLTDESVRSYAIEQVEHLVGRSTRIIIGHSLGSVVAYEVAHRLERDIPLLVTLGSPIGLRSIIYDRLRPQPPAFPPKIRRWVNLAGRDDLVAAVPNLNPLFEPTKPSDCLLEGGWLLDTGSRPHDAGYYLTKRETGLPIAQTFLDV